MFTKIEEGVKIYKKAFKVYLEHCEEIANMKEKNRPTGFQEWRDAERNRLDGMTAALGLSLNERVIINKAVADNIK